MRRATARRRSEPSAMRMLREFFDYFFAVLMGRRDTLSNFLEPLTMGERYFRWGLETRDIRDFRSGMDYLHLCHDSEAPMASLLVRKYACIGEIAAAATETFLMRHRRVIEDSIKTEKRYREELEEILRRISELKDYILKLQRDGSLIQAQTEQTRVAGLEASAERLREVIDSGEGKAQIFESYDEITSDSIRFFRELDHAAEVVMASRLLGKDGAETLSNQLRMKLEQLRAILEGENPVNKPELS